ncbi:MAG: ROK family transcriptional regulator, partial [Pseudomonadota bacterium]|nr:ROK family transcriptional regulator [Pseudomonadota bacterium]
RHNQRRILQSLRWHGPMSRTELSAATGLSASTVTAITAAFLESATLAEMAPPDNMASRRGRPQVTLALNPATASAGALSLSLNRISAAAVDYAGNVVSEVVKRVPTRDADARTLADAMVTTLREAFSTSATPLGPLRHIAMGVQGVTDSAGTTMLWSPITRHTDLRLGEMLGEAFGVPAMLANDCNMIAKALKRRDPDRFGASFAAVLLSHGIGMGLFVNGEQVGGIESSATEFGHMVHDQGGALCRCGRRGCVEAYAGDYAIWRAASGHDAQEQPVDDLESRKMLELVGRARSEDGAERRAYHTAGLAIGSALRSMFALFDPFPVAFVGTGAAAFDLLEPSIRESIGRSAIGMATSDIEMYTFSDEFPLVRDGAAFSALASIDDLSFAPAGMPANHAQRSLGRAS